MNQAVVFSSATWEAFALSAMTFPPVLKMPYATFLPSAAEHKVTAHRGWPVGSQACQLDQRPTVTAITAPFNGTVWY
jgi:hypothetical protein